MNVRSNPATAVGVFFASSTRVMVSMAAWRASGVMSAGSVVVFAAMRCAVGTVAGCGRPRGAVVTGPLPAPNKFAIAVSVAVVPIARPAPLSTPAGPVPSHRPGGLPESV